MRLDSCRPARLLAAFVAPLLIACHASVLQAAGLGQARALSALGQPLHVRVELLMEPGERPAAIKAQVSSPSLGAASAANHLTATVVSTAEGKAGVVVRSSAPVYLPYVELFVAVTSSAGRSDRSFVVALPPVRPGIAAPRPARPAPGSANTDAKAPSAAPPIPSAAQAPAPIARTDAAAAPVPGAAPAPAQIAAQAPVKPPQRQAVGKVGPPPAAAQPRQPGTSQPTRSGAAHGDGRKPSAEASNSDGSVVISAIGDYATVTGDSGTSGTAQSRTYRALTPEEVASGEAAPHQPEACCTPSPTSPPVQAPAAVPPQGPGDAASGMATGQLPEMPAAMPPRTMVQVVPAPAAAPAPPNLSQAPDPSPASVPQPGPAQGPEEETQAAAAVAGKPQTTAPKTLAGKPDAASATGKWTYLEQGLALLVILLTGLLAYLAWNKRAG